MNDPLALNPDLIPQEELLPTPEIPPIPQVMNLTSDVPPILKRYKKPGRRKAGFRMDTPPWPVRAIWEMAPPQERQEAYQMGVQLLEHWLGRISRKDLAEKLKLPPLRVWQMSQQALSGMVVALMAQPKRPPQGTPVPSPTRPEQDELKALRKEVQKLREEKRTLEDLLVLLRDMPGQGDPSQIKGKKTGTKAPNPMAREGRGLALEI